VRRKLVLDSYALIAYLEDEKGADTVQRVLEQAERGKSQVLMSMVNWGEVYYSICRTTGEKRAEECIAVVDQLPISLVAADRKQVCEASKIKAKHSIAFGDCFAAALAIQNGCEVITGDREFRKLGTKVRILYL